MNSKRIGIIGAGRFGRVLVERLADSGNELLVIDSSAEKIQAISGLVPRAVRGDATLVSALREADFASCDKVVVTITDDIEASIIATVNCKDLKIPQVIARAASDMHGKILKRVGADWVINPDREYAWHLARSLLEHSPVDLYELADGVSVAEVPAPPETVGSTLVEADVRRRFGVTVLGIRRQQEDPRLPRLFIMATGSERIGETDHLVLFGPDNRIESFSGREAE